MKQIASSSIYMARKDSTMIFHANIQPPDWCGSGKQRCFVFQGAPAEIFTPEVYGKAMGFVNGVGYFVAAFATKIFGMLVVVNANGTKDYKMGWVFIAACALAGIVAALFIKSTAPAAVVQGRGAVAK